MIFKKLFKGTDLDFDISVDKAEYKPGDTVRGVITLHTKMTSRARQLKLIAEGRESTNIKVDRNTSTSSGSSSSTHTYSEVNTFFSDDLSQLLQRSVTANAIGDGTLEILPQIKEIPVEFTLPSENELYSTYKGKNANITYTLKATLDTAKKLDVNKEEIFAVKNPNNIKVKDMASSGDNAITPEYEKNLSSPSPLVVEEEIDNSTDKESYAARFERIFGKKTNSSSENRASSDTFHGSGVSFDLGTLLPKGREKYLKENSDARIELLNQGNNNNMAFSPGQTLRGKVIALALQSSEEENKKNIREIKIILSGIEYAYAQGYQRVSTVEKYENKIEISGNTDNNNNSVIPFEFQIPSSVNQSYTGRYSEYYWGLEAKINIAWSSDIIARTIIEIV
jgi:hypothetical protein